MSSKEPGSRAKIILLNECNIDSWPMDLRPLPRQPGTFHYGHLRPGYFATIRDRFVELYREKKLGIVNRAPPSPDDTAIG